MKDQQFERVTPKQYIYPGKPFSGSNKNRLDLVLFVDASSFDFRTREKINEQAKIDFRRYCNRNGVSHTWLIVPQSGIAFYMDRYKLQRIKTSPYHKILNHPSRPLNKIRNKSNIGQV